ncbi:MAG: sugar phosphate isomerase/epimerase family protein [Opitutaceae bacterium]
MFKKCYSTLGCPSDTLDQVLQTAQKFNLDCVEIRALENEIDLPAYFTQKGITPELLKQRCKETGIQISAFNSSLKLATDESEWIQTLDAWAPWIIGANVPAVRIFDGVSENGYEAWMEHAKSRALFWKQLKAERGWNFDLIIETHDTLLTAETILEFVEATEGAFPILWDAHHTWRKGGEAFAETWKACRDHIQHIHTKDSISVPSARHPFTYADYGKGEMNPEALSQILLESGYTGVLSLEWELMWHPYLAPLDSALADFCASLDKVEAN